MTKTPSICDVTQLVANVRKISPEADIPSERFYKHKGLVINVVRFDYPGVAAGEKRSRGRLMRIYYHHRKKTRTSAESAGALGSAAASAD